MYHTPVKANKKNPLGLFKNPNNGILCRIKGFLNFNAYEKDGLPTIGKLSKGIFDIKSVYSDNKHNEIEPVCDVMRSIKYNFLEKDKDYIFHAGVGVSIVFTLHQEEVSLKDFRHIAKNPKQAIFDYLSVHENIPLLSNDNRIIGDFIKAMDKNTPQNNDFWNPTFIDNKKMEQVFHIGCSEKNARRKFYEESKEKKSLLEIKNFDYSRELLQKTALLKGGFIEVDINNESYFVPKIPLICYLRAIDNKTFDYDKYTWFFENKENCFETYAINDMLLGSNIPFDLFNDKDKLDILLVTLFTKLRKTNFN